MSKETNRAPRGWKTVSGADQIDRDRWGSLDRIGLQLPIPVASKGKSDEIIDPHDIMCGCSQCELTGLNNN